MRKSLGDKRRELSPEQIEQITDIHGAFQESDHCKIFDTEDFGFRKITVERPLRLNFQASEERIERLKDERAFQNLAKSKKKNAAAKAEEEAEGREQQETIIAMLQTLPRDVFKDRPSFEEALEAAAEEAGVKLRAPIRKAILSALSERDETAEVCQDKDGNPEADPELRDYERVPLTEGVEEFFAREVAPHVRDAWINTAVRDHRDGEVGKVGYEMNFNRYFYKYESPRPLEEIEADIRQVEQEILGLLREVTE